jgi:hypothetical protein
MGIIDTDHRPQTTDDRQQTTHFKSFLLPDEQLQHKFVSTFVLGDVMTCFYIVKIESIWGLLNVFKDYGAHVEDVNKLFCTLPRR